MAAGTGNHAPGAIGTIASEETASLYGLEVLASGINGQRDNSTRFAILSKNEKQLSPAAGTFILMFAVKNEAGALVKVLNKLGEFGCNMSVIHSRPLKGLAWSYYFYIEADGEYGTPAYEQMLSEMRKTVHKSGESDFARQTYEDMLYDEYADSMTKNAGFGLADQIYLSLVG